MREQLIYFFGVDIRKEEFKFECPEFILVMPTFRTLRLPDFPIDNIGIQPDIYLDASVADWVEFAGRYLEE